MKYEFMDARDVTYSSTVKIKGPSYNDLQGDAYLLPD